MASIARRVTELKDDFQRVLTPAMVEAAAEAAGHRWRERVLGPTMTVALFALQILHGNVACRAVRHLAGMDFTDTAYANARKRLPLDLFTRGRKTGQAGKRDRSNYGKRVGWWLSRWTGRGWCGCLWTWIGNRWKWSPRTERVR